MTLLEPYLPSEGGAIAANGGYAEGGALLALGLIHGKPNCASSKRKATVAYLRSQLRANQANEVVCHGAAMGIGLAGLGCLDAAIFNELREVLYTDSAVAGEAAGLAMGMVQVRKRRAGSSCRREQQNRATFRTKAVLLNFGSQPLPNAVPFVLPPFVRSSARQRRRR